MAQHLHTSKLFEKKLIPLKGSRHTPCAVHIVLQQTAFQKSMETITLTYKRLPDRINYFEQQLLYEDENVIVTSQRITPSSPIIINGETVLGDNYTAVWFVFTGLWYDIGKIYNLNSEWTGYYCDIIKPVNRQEGKFEIVDLFLDVWVSPDNSFEIQDEDEFETAVRNGDISHELAEQARKALSELILTIETGQFPPEFVENFTIPLII